MSVTFGFYNSLNGDRKYNAEQMSAIFDGIINDGIYMSIGTCMVVKATTGLTISVGVGRAWFNHTWTLNDSELLLNLEPADLLLNRIDAVVLEVNAKDDTRTNTIKVITGKAASEPVRPTLTKENGLYQYPLAYIYVAKGATAVTTSNITNMVGTSDTPYVTGIIKTINIDDLVAQWQSQWNDWKSGVEADNESWTTEQRAAWTSWVNTQETEFTSWMANYKEELELFQGNTEESVNAWYDSKQAEFIAWFENVRNQLSEDPAGNLQNQIDDINFEISKMIIKYNYKDTTFNLNNGEAFPFEDIELNNYYKVASINVNGENIPEFDNAIVYVFNSTISCIAGHKKGNYKRTYAAISYENGVYHIDRYTPEYPENKVTEISDSSTDDKYPSAKAVRNFVVNNGNGAEIIKGISLESHANKYVINATSKTSAPYTIGKQMALIPTVLGDAIDKGNLIANLVNYTTSTQFNNSGHKVTTGGEADFTTPERVLLQNLTNGPGVSLDADNENSTNTLRIDFKEPLIVFSNESKPMSFTRTRTPSLELRAYKKSGGYKYWTFSSRTKTDEIVHKFWMDTEVCEITSMEFIFTGYIGGYSGKFGEVVIPGYNKALNSKLPIYLNLNGLGERLLNFSMTTDSNLKNYFIGYTNSNTYDLVSANGETFTAKTGTIANGSVIPQTPGYKNYLYFVSPSSGSAYVSSTELSWDDNGGGVAINCSVNQSTRVVSSTLTFSAATSNTGYVTNTVNMTANYVELAWN